jgi:hypothetical protein
MVTQDLFSAKGKPFTIPSLSRKYHKKHLYNNRLSE